MVWSLWIRTLKLEIVKRTNTLAFSDEVHFKHKLNEKVVQFTCNFSKKSAQYCSFMATRKSCSTVFIFCLGFLSWHSIALYMVWVQLQNKKYNTVWCNRITSEETLLLHSTDFIRDHLKITISWKFLARISNSTRKNGATWPPRCFLYRPVRNVKAAFTVIPTEQ